MMNIFGNPECIYRKNSHGQLISKEIGYGKTGKISFTIETAMTPDQPIRGCGKVGYNEQDNLSLNRGCRYLEQKSLNKL